MNLPTVKKIDIYDLGNPSQKDKYEKLLNSEELALINREEFAYDKIGRAKITVWYEIYED